MWVEESPPIEPGCPDPTSRGTVAVDGRRGSARRPSTASEQEAWEKARQAAKEAGKGSHPSAKPMFVDANAMKERLRETMCKPKYDVAEFYHKQGVFQHIARHSAFEKATLTVIAFNAAWISIDTDHNHADMLLDAQPEFQIAEQFFCTYFSFEWFVRFMAFARKRDGFRDAWFVFDSIMVFMMVMETWVMTMTLLVLGGPSANGGLGNASILRLLRLLRLSRMARMARLLRCMPELLILVKGMKAAMRSVFFTLLLLLILLYVFGIAFTQICKDATSTEVRKYFDSVSVSMHTLLIDGTMLDDVGAVVDALGRDSYVLAAVFYFFVLMSALTVMNMLIGVLCEVVSAVAATEREELQVGFVKEKLTQILVDEGLDEDGDHQISRAEFEKLLEKPGAARLLQEVDVDVLGLVDLADYIFEEDDESEDAAPMQLSFEKFMEVVLELRGKNVATVKDMVDLRKFIKVRLLGLEEKVTGKLHQSIRNSLLKRGCDGSPAQPMELAPLPQGSVAARLASMPVFPGVSRSSVASKAGSKSSDGGTKTSQANAKCSDTTAAPAPAVRSEAQSSEDEESDEAKDYTALGLAAPPALPAAGSPEQPSLQWWQQAARLEWALAAAHRELLALEALEPPRRARCSDPGVGVGGDCGGRSGPEANSDAPWPSFASPPVVGAQQEGSPGDKLMGHLDSLSQGIAAARRALLETRETLTLDDLGLGPPAPRWAPPSGPPAPCWAGAAAAGVAGGGSADSPSGPSSSEPGAEPRLSPAMSSLRGAGYEPPDVPGHVGEEPPNPHFLC